MGSSHKARHVAAAAPARRSLAVGRSSLRIGIVHPFLANEVRRGGERYLEDLAWYLHRHGDRVEVVTSRARGSEPIRSEVSTRVVPRLAHPWLRARGITPVDTHGLAATAVLARRRYDVVHALTPSAALAGRATGHPTLYSELGHPTVEDLGGHPARARLWRTAVRHATIVTALSASAAQAVEAFGGRRCEVLNPGTRLDRFTPDLAPRRGPPRLLFLSDARQPRKGLDLVLGALARLSLHHPSIRLLLGGPGEQVKPASDAGVEGPTWARVDVLGVGEPSELPARYRGATVTLLPSENEAFGLVLTESLACGTPVVCSASGGMAEVVDDPRVGRTFPTGDIDGLARAIDEAIQIAADPATPTRCRRHAERWGWDERIGPEHQDLYTRLARRLRR